MVHLHSTHTWASFNAWELWGVICLVGIKDFLGNLKTNGGACVCVCEFKFDDVGDMGFDIFGVG